MSDMSPIPMTQGEADVYAEHALCKGCPTCSVKRLDCSFYRECLSVAEKGDWPGFGCAGCKAYQGIDAEQRVQDVMALLTIEEAAKNADNLGCAGRKRGVKPGADSKPAVRQGRHESSVELADGSRVDIKLPIAEMSFAEVAAKIAQIKEAIRDIPDEEVEKEDLGDLVKISEDD